jgi:3'-phosphoadenosine 5'-phosphosulfate sulfotransferase (PAPS reductase)/FAD synthetase
LKLALDKFDRSEIVGLFCDTQFEHPLTYQHVRNISLDYDVVIEKVSDGDVLTRCLRYGRFPGGGARHCTDDLKIKPTKRFIENLAAKQGEGFEVWYGMRQNESQERGKRYAGLVDGELYAPHEILPAKYPAHLEKMGVMFRLPIVDWTSAEVMDFLEGQHNPLYDEGFERVGCFPCLASGDKWKEKAFQFDAVGAEHYEQVVIVEKRIGKSIWTSKSGSQRNNPEQGCLICAM